MTEDVFEDITVDAAEDACARVRAVLTPDLLAPAYRAKFSIDNPTAGHCAVAAEAVYFLLGGPRARLVAKVATLPDATTHWWLEGPCGRIDPTAAQFAAVGAFPPYAHGRAIGFMGMRRDPTSIWGFGLRPSRRARSVLQRVAETFA